MYSSTWNSELHKMQILVGTIRFSERLCEYSESQLLSQTHWSDHLRKTLPVAAWVDATSTHSHHGPDQSSQYWEWGYTCANGPLLHTVQVLFREMQVNGK